MELTEKESYFKYCYSHATEIFIREEPAGGGRPQALLLAELTPERQEEIITQWWSEREAGKQTVSASPSA